MTLPITIAAHASESGGHFYDRNGNQIAGVPYAKSNKAKAGQLRAPTIRDARENNWGPGVTTIIKAAAAPGLTRWLIRQHVLAALTLPRQIGESDDAYLSRLEADAQTHGREAAEEGTRIHAAIQDFFANEAMHPTYERHVQGALLALGETFGTDSQWSAELGVAHPYGYGTKADLVGLCGERSVIVDWKGKETSTDYDTAMAELQSEKLYESHEMQLAATRKAVAANVPAYATAACAIGFVSRDCPGAVFIRQCKEDALDKGWGMFHSLLCYWQTLNSYVPQWKD